MSRLPRGAEPLHGISLAHVLLLVAASLASPLPALGQADVGGASVTADVMQPERAFGRVLGDVLVQRVPLAVSDAIEPAALPAEGRVDVWFARLPTRVVPGEGSDRHVELRYQIVNSPDVATVASLPASALTLADGRRVEVAAWPVSISPLVPAAAVLDAAPPDAQALPRLRPDRLLPPLDTAPLARRAALATLALTLVLLAWGGWWLWRRRRDAVRLPFARALAELRALDARGRNENPLAWRALHGALNATADGAHHPSRFAALRDRAPWLAPYRERLAAFHDASSGRFFEQPPRVEPFDLRALARELSRAERRQAR